MGKFIGKSIKTIKALGRGSEYYGACEVCKKHMSEAVIAEKSLIYVRECGQHYLSGGSSTFAHRECVSSDRTAEKSVFERVGRSLNVTIAQIKLYGVDA